MQNESDLDISDSRISSTSLVQELIQKLPENGWLEEKKITPQLGFLAAYDSSINKPTAEFAGNKQIRSEEKVSVYKPQSVLKTREEKEVSKYISSDEIPPAIKKYGPLPKNLLIVTDDVTLKRLNAYPPAEQVEPATTINDRIISIDTYPFEKKKTIFKTVEEQDSLQENFQLEFDEREPYVARKSAGQPVSVSNVDGNKGSVATPEDVKKYNEFRKKFILKERNITPSFEDNKSFKEYF
ncbi:uncharacterized protein isoform X2 [Rhodnius prolixus]